MAQDIRCEYTGNATRQPVSLAGDAESMRVVLVTFNGDETTEEVLFTGSEFSEEELVRRLEANPSPLSNAILARLKSAASK